MRTFPEEGMYALIEGDWRSVSTGPARDDIHVIDLDKEEFDRWVAPHEIGRRWSPSRGTGAVDVTIHAIDELVEVRWTGRYRGLDVFPLGPVLDGWVAVSPVSLAEDAGEDLGFRGSARFGDRHKRIPVEEFVDVSEEIKVVYRRGEGWLRG